MCFCFNSEIQYYSSKPSDILLTTKDKWKRILSIIDLNFNNTTNLSSENVIGLTSFNIGGYEPGDVEFVAAFDIADSKVGTDLSETIFAPPNNAIKIIDVPPFDVKVQKGDVLDGAGRHFSERLHFG